MEMGVWRGWTDMVLAVVGRVDEDRGEEGLEWAVWKEDVVMLESLEVV